MKMNKEEAKKYIQSLLDTTELFDFETDNHGQVVIYTGVFVQNDCSFSEEPDPYLLDD